jgi:hypothetical protein
MNETHMTDTPGTARKQCACEAPATYLVSWVQEPPTPKPGIGGGMKVRWVCAECVPAGARVWRTGRNAERRRR